MKKIIIFGATGSVGRHLVSQATEKGYEISVFSRSGNLFTSNANLNLITGNVFNLPDVSGAIAGHDVVLCALGDGRLGKVRAAGTRNIIESMKKNGVSRLICQTTLGCGESWNNLNFFWKNIMFGWFLKRAFLDHEEQEKFILDSELDWTVIRPGAFTNGPLTRNFHYNFGMNQKGLELKISRADLAWFMLKQISENKFLRKTVSVSY
jgi:putative NADH-flavin reductase